MQNGAYYALSAYGAQDEWVKKLPDEAFDAKKSLLKDKDFKRVYQQVAFKGFNKKSETGLIYTLDSTCDLIHNVDVYIPIKNINKLNEILYSIEIEIGGQRIDKIYTSPNTTLQEWIRDKKGDIETLLNTNAELFDSKRKVSYTETHIIVPLHLAPLHNMNLVFPSCKYHDMKIIFQGDLAGYSLDDFQIYAECYYVDPRNKFVLQEMTHTFPTYQNIHGIDSCVLKKGINKFNLHFNHPVHCIYLWGFDKKKVKRITLTLNELGERTEQTVYYDGSLEPLEYHKKSRGINAEPVFIFFSDSNITERPTSTINFSRLDRPTLLIETEQEDEPILYANGINVQGYKCMSGMFGLIYSK